MIVRAATPDHVPMMARILSGWIDATPWMPRIHTRQEDAGFCASLVPHAWIAAPDHGFMALRDGEIDALYLAPASRRRGHGRALIEAAKARHGRLALWTFQANEKARAFYAAQGFAETARTDGDNEEGLPDARLEWRRA